MINNGEVISGGMIPKINILAINAAIMELKERCYN